VVSRFGGTRAERRKSGRAMSRPLPTVRAWSRQQPTARVGVSAWIAPVRRLFD